MERYEFREGASHKFWEVSVNGDELTVRFGKMGTAGQTKTKTFASAAAAEKEKSKLVKEKTGKGYVAAGSTAPAAAVARSETPKAAPAAKKSSPKPKAETKEADEIEKPAASPAPAAMKAPAPSPAASNVRLVTGEPLPTRMRPAKVRTADEAWTAFAHALQQMAAEAKNKDEWPTHIVSGTPPSSMSPETAASWSTELHTAASGSIQGRGYVVHENWGDFLELYTDFAFWLVAAHGAVLAMRTVELLPEASHATAAHYGTAPWSIVPHIAFRSAITAAPPADYDDAVRHYLAQPSPGWERDAALAFILADDRPERHALQVVSVLVNAAAQGVDVGATPSLVSLIAEAPTSLAKAWRSKRTYFIYFVYFALSAERIAATAVAAARGHQESALPVLDWLLHYATDDTRTTIACAMLDTQEEDALAVLLPYLHEKPIRAALDQASETNPAWMFQRALALLAGARAEPALRARALKAIEMHGAQTTGAWAQALGGRSEKYYATLAALGNQATADAKDVPSFLRAPPWRAAKKASTDIVLRIEPKDSPLVFNAKGVVAPPEWIKTSVPDSVAALVELIAAAEKEIASNSWRRIQPSRQPLPPLTASEQDVYAWLSGRLDEVAAGSRWASSSYVSLLNAVHLQQDALALLMWDKPAAMHLGWGIDWRTRISAMLTRFGDKAVPGLVKIVEADPTALLAHVKDVETPALAPVAARAYMKLKKAREPGRAWLRAHPRAALLRLVPLAVGPLGANRDAAEYAVRWYKTEKPDVLDAVIAEYAAAEPQVPAAIAQVLARDPYARTPNKVAKPPSWVVISSLTRPKLKAGGALPDDAMTALVEMLSFVNPADVYAGVPALREACTPDSLAAFAWDLFSAWLANGAPSKEGWALRALGWLGDDESARQLTRLVRKWPGEAAHARAVTGLDVLADIGSDVALMNLNGIAEKVKFKGLQERARDKIAAIAEARDLSPEELADRLAPDLDLDARGGLDLDFGPRKFRAGFDEFLKPWVKDESGKRLKDLPKPLKSDDAEKSGEASAKWSALKKDARAIASQQLTRLECMLATGRRAKGEVFHTFFAAHPLIRHLAQRLVWGDYDTDKVDAAPKLYFRVTEDLSFNDANDDPVTVDVGPEATGLIGLAHPLHMSADDQARWGALFGDYEIAQPFAQLGRETYALTDAEKAADKLTRFAGKQIESKRLRGMAARGWHTGQPQDAGGILWIERTVTLADGTQVPAMLHFSDGLWAGAASEEPPIQTLHDITLDADYWSRQKARRLGELDAVTASEILRAITQLVESGGT